MELVLNNRFCEMNLEETENINGGKWYNAVLTGAGGVATTITICGIASGSGAAIATMGVGALAACGPAGWAILGIAAVGGAATGAATLAAWRS